MRRETAPTTQRPGWFYRLLMGFLGLFDRWLHLSCKSFIATASANYERPLRRGERLRQAIHRAMCKLCRLQERRMAQLRMLTKETGTASADDLPATLSPEASERIRQAMIRAAGQKPTEDS